MTEVPAPIESAPAPAEVAAAGEFAGNAVIGSEFDFSNLLDPNFDNSGFTAEDAAVRGEPKVGRGADLAGAEKYNVETTATTLGLTAEEFDKARKMGLLSAPSGNPGIISSLDDEQRVGILEQINAQQ